MLMKRRLHIVSLFAILTLTPFLSVPVLASEAVAIEQLTEEEAVITVSGQTVTVTGAQGQTLEVVSLTGRRVLTVKIETPAQRIELNIPKGCYILKVGKVVRKVSVR